MKKFLLILLGFLLYVNAHAQVTTYVEVREPGILLDLLTEQEIEQTEKIVISGNELSDNDYDVLKSMMARYKLRDIDLEQTYISVFPSKVFQGCTNLEHIKLPKYLIDTGWYAFSGCYNLSSIDLPNSVESIRNSFRECGSLTSITFGRRLRSISGTQSFYLSGIKEIHCKGSIPPDLEYGSFEGQYKNAILYVPQGCKRAYMFADGWLNFENIQEEYVEPAYSLQVKLYGGSFMWQLYPSYDGKGGYVVQEIYPDQDYSFEVEKEETICFHLAESGTIYQLWKIDKVLLNGEDITDQVTEDNMLSLDLIQDSKLEVFMKDEMATANEEIQTMSKHIKTVANGIQIDVPQLSDIKIYTINGTLVKFDRISGMKEYSLSKGIYVVTIGNKSQKIIVR